MVQVSGTLDCSRAYPAIVPADQSGNALSLSICKVLFDRHATMLVLPQCVALKEYEIYTVLTVSNTWTAQSECDGWCCAFPRHAEAA